MNQLRKCKAIGCNTVVSDHDFCRECVANYTASFEANVKDAQLTLIPAGIEASNEAKPARNSGGNVNYYLVPINKPKRLEPYTAECEDIIEALGMNFAEGCAFKAIWRRCAQRALGEAKLGYDGGTYDAEKAMYYAGRMVEQDKKLQA